MIRKLMASSAVIALMSAGAISAQAQTDPAKPAIVQDNAAAVPDSNAQSSTQLADSKQPIAPNQPTLASTIIGKSVYSSSDPQSDNIGDVNDLIVAEDGSVTHAVIGVGGFLGIGEKNVAVPFDELMWSRTTATSVWSTRQPRSSSRPRRRSTVLPMTRRRAVFPQPPTRRRRIPPA